MFIKWPKIVPCKQYASTEKMLRSPKMLWRFWQLEWLLSLSMLQKWVFAVAQCRYLPLIKGYSQYYKICTLLKIEPRREIKLSGSKEYLCFESNNSRTWSSWFHFHMAFLVVEILNQRRLIKYAKISDKRPFLEGVPLTWTENDILT